MNCSFLHCSSFFQLSRRTVIAKTSLSLNKQGRRRETKKKRFLFVLLSKRGSKKVEERKCENLCLLFGIAGWLHLPDFSHWYSFDTERDTSGMEFILLQPPFSSFKYKAGRYLFSSDFLKEYRNWASG